MGDIELAKELIAGAQIVLTPSFSQFHVRWNGGDAAAKEAFRIANKRTRVGSPGCISCHLKAWVCLNMIVQEAEVNAMNGDVQRTRLDPDGKWEVENADGTKMEGRLE